MSSIPPHMAKFVTAMQYVYKFPTTPSADAESWTPPPASAGHKGRYLWTDAFGVLNFITLSRTTQSPHYLTLARSLVHTVHNTLGRTRDGSAHLPRASPSNPLAGGLRIGKEDATGPDADGQYHHYLTLWMFALNRLSLATRDKSYNDAAISLARAIHPAFVYDRASARPRMYWKMSVDLSRPLVRSEGNLDPVDGFVVFRLLQRTDGEDSQALREEIADYEKIVRTKWRGYGSDDPLDLGMTLWTAHWFAGEGKGEEWADGLVERAKKGVEGLFAEGYFEASLRRRLAFREFGTAMGMRCAMEGEEWERRAEHITDAWEKGGLLGSEDGRGGVAGRNVEDDLKPITMVMYAAALCPGAFQKGFL